MKPLFPYDREAAISYARKWALRRNPDYYNFANLGGDCTNFISQCLYAGAKRMNNTPTYGWYYKNLSNRTPSWTGARFLYDFLKNNKNAGPQAVITTHDGIIAGDIIQLQNNTGIIYHSLFVLKAGEKILLAAHDLDSYNRSLDTYQYADIVFWHIIGVGQ